MIEASLAALSAAANAVTVLQAIPKLSSDSNAKLAIAELNLQLATVKTTLAHLITENQQLRAQLSAKETPETLTLKDGMYYTKDGDGPFCTTCFDSKSQKIRLTDLPRRVRTMVGTHKCNVCDSKYGARR